MSIAGRPQKGDLVLTDDCYHGIVVSETDILLGNGCQEVLTPEKMRRACRCQLNTLHDDAWANFRELVECRAPCQIEPRVGRLHRGFNIHVFERGDGWYYSIQKGQFKVTHGNFVGPETAEQTAILLTAIIEEHLDL